MIPPPRRLLVVEFPKRKGASARLDPFVVSDFAESVNECFGNGKITCTGPSH